MKRRNIIHIGTTLLLVLFTFPTKVFACACCSDIGDYGISFTKPASSQLDLLKQMRFGENAMLYTNAAGMDSIRGLSNPKESYVLKGAIAASMFSLAFHDGQLSGVLNLRMPARMLSYRADIHDNQTSPGGGPLLYKEWRFEGLVNGTGFFRTGLSAPAKYFLVLQGRGNNCDNAEDFTHWRIEVTGKNASYAFFGELAKAPVN